MGVDAEMLFSLRDGLGNKELSSLAFRLAACFPEIARVEHGKRKAVYEVDWHSANSLGARFEPTSGGIYSVALSCRYYDEYYPRGPIKDLSGELE